MHSANAPERRRHPRHIAAQPLALVMAGEGNPQVAALRDVSALGCRFMAEPSLEPGRQVSLTFMSEGRLCGATGSIIRAEDGGVFGVEFAVRNDRYQEFVDALDGAQDAAREQLLGSVRDPQLFVM